MKNVIDKIIEHQKRIKIITQPAVTAMSNLQNSALAKTIQNIDTSPVIEAVKNLTETVKHWQDIIEERDLTNDELSKFLSELNYPPLTWDLSTSLLQELNSKLGEVESFDEKIEMLDQFIVEIFNDKYLNDKLEFWRDFDCLKDRIHLIQEIVNGHKLELFSLSTLAVFPQIEGVLAENFPNLRDNKGNFTVPNQKKALEKILNTKFNQFDHNWESYYINEVLSSFRHLEPIENLSRHAIAHGASKDYGTIVNSTKSLMIFDYIITKVELYNINED